ncbi:hypothetical protein HJ590_14520 [Naumannella sp. ID2617S]|uniref:Uncharacterized protein n=1 Tax=Enemella dayhoffiae TaxID=2016507 RepID=A0A255H592_9ACTN|nr:hypothetical protein [Enemella dayhoffiae]NNG20751.1 hypothetical protein [Naumannella sp. ID2617S]OYO22821.1 hypothetical protein CGZ93_07200 [Enemella dayhoffiae]
MGEPADYTSEELGGYGVTAQPLVVRRMRPHLRGARIGLGSAVLATLAAVLTSVLLPRWDDGSIGWSIAGIVSAVLMLGICGLQAWAWGEAMAEWRGVKDVNLSGVLAPSWWAHLVSYPVALAGAVSAVWQAREAGWADLSCWTALAMLPLLLVAHVLAAVEYLRLDGPPGTLPNHFRRLVRSQNPDAVDRKDPAAAILE